MEDNKKALEVFYLFTSMKKIFGILRQYLKTQTQNDLEAAILIFLKFHSDVTQVKIVERLNVPKQTVSYAINKLEKEGSIITKSHQTDKRKKILNLTDKGKSYAKKYLKPLMILNEKIYDDMTSKKLEMMKKQMDELIKIIEKNTEV